MSDISQLSVIRESGSAPCPHCTKQIIMTIESQKPRVVAFVAPEACFQAKKDIAAGLKSIEGLPDDAKVNVENWLGREDTLVTPGDVEIVLNNLKQAYAKAEAPKA